jgi:hypothetical protein
MSSIADPQSEMSSVVGPEPAMAGAVVAPHAHHPTVSKKSAAALLAGDLMCGTCRYALQGGCYVRVAGECGGGCSCPFMICGSLIQVIKRLCPSMIQADGTITRGCTSGSATEELIEELARIVLEFLDRIIFWKRMVFGMCVVSALLLAGLAYALLLR